MLFWLFVIILAVGIGLLVVGNMSWDREKHNFLYINDYEIRTAGALTTVISAVVLAIMTIILCCQYIGVDAQVEKNKEIYHAIEYKVTSGACRDEFGLLSKTVIDEVEDWNKDVKYYQTLQNDFWVGVFIPNVFDQFEIIDYESYNRGE